jgi:Myotubularin protein
VVVPSFTPTVSTGSLLGAYPRILSSVLALLLGEAVISSAKASTTDTVACERRARSASRALIRATQPPSAAGDCADHSDEEGQEDLDSVAGVDAANPSVAGNGRVGTQYQEARRLLSMREARRLFGRLLTLRRSRPCVLDVRRYKMLCGLITEALQLASAAHEAQLCSLLMNMACTFYRPATGGARHFPCSDSALRQLPFWQETRYWEECLFDALVREREGLVHYKERFWRDMSLREQEELQSRERNVAFAQLGSCIHFMFSFGVRRPKIDAFIGRQAEIQDLSAEQYQLLTHNVLALHQMHSPHMYAPGSRLSIVNAEPVRMAHLSAQAERLSGGEVSLDICPVPEAIPLVWLPTQASGDLAASWEAASAPASSSSSSSCSALECVLVDELRTLVCRVLDTEHGHTLIAQHLAETHALLQQRSATSPQPLADESDCAPVISPPSTRCAAVNASASSAAAAAAASSASSSCPSTPSTASSSTPASSSARSASPLSTSAVPSMPSSSSFSSAATTTSSSPTATQRSRLRTESGHSDDSSTRRYFLAESRESRVLEQPLPSSSGDSSSLDRRVLSQEVPLSKVTAKQSRARHISLAATRSAR